MTEPTSRAAIQAELDLWWDALSAVSTGQSYQIGARQLTRADIQEVRNTIQWLTQQRNSFVDAARVSAEVTTPAGFKVASWSGTTT